MDCCNDYIIRPLPPAERTETYSTTICLMPDCSAKSDCYANYPLFLNVKNGIYDALIKQSPFLPSPNVQEISTK